jgi:hypothetical protein
VTSVFALNSGDIIKADSMRRFLQFLCWMHSNLGWI